MPLLQFLLSHNLLVYATLTWDAGVALHLQTDSCGRPLFTFTEGSLHGFNLVALACWKPHARPLCSVTYCLHVISSVSDGFGFFKSSHVSVPISETYHCALWYNETPWSLQLFDYMHLPSLQLPFSTGDSHWNLVLSRRSHQYFMASNRENIFHFCFL